MRKVVVEMNNKGTTLLETVMAILILSIASTIIITGTLRVIRVMSEGNEIKNNSDIMLSYAEKTDDATTRLKVKNDISKPMYIIYDGNGKRIEVENTLSTLHVIGDEKINLKAIRGYEGLLVKDTHSYLDSIAFTRKLMDNIQQSIHELVEGGLAENSFSYNETLRSVFFNMGSSWGAFSGDLLPKELGGQYYIHASFPWDSADVEEFTYTHGGTLICLSKHNIEPYDKGNFSEKEVVRIVYDHAGNWYYYPNNDGKYAVSYNWLIEDQGINNFWVKNTSTGIYENSIASWDDFLIHIKTEKNGWEKLDKESLFKRDDIDSSWILINND